MPLEMKLYTAQHTERTATTKTNQTYQKIFQKNIIYKTLIHNTL